VVDDHEEVRGFIESLMSEDFDLRFAVNGRDALQQAVDYPPDLVVSDVMMPEMDGTELCAALKSDPNLKNIPVILLTARVGSEATLEAYAHGADDFVAKPFHPRVLMARIRAQLRLRDLGLQLAEREKLAAVGTLAAGILHEVRNPVNAILNASRLLQQGVSDKETEKELAAVVADGAQRIQEITVALDSHARPAEAGEAMVSDLREGVDATLRLIRHRLGGIKVNRIFETDRLARCASGPLNQVILNLLDNSIRAGAGEISVSLREDRDVLQLWVEDNGPGVPEDSVERIFDPFFTTREDGTGTGLGLYLSRKIVNDQGGSLWYEYRPDGGALFIIEIPSIEAH
jgi:signal transduction histidine kinase